MFMHIIHTYTPTHKHINAWMHTYIYTHAHIAKKTWNDIYQADISTCWNSEFFWFKISYLGLPVSGPAGKELGSY